MPLFFGVFWFKKDSLAVDGNSACSWEDGVGKGTCRTPGRMARKHWWL